MLGRAGRTFDTLDGTAVYTLARFTGELLGGCWIFGCFRDGGIVPAF